MKIEALILICDTSTGTLVWLLRPRIGASYLGKHVTRCIRPCKPIVQDKQTVMPPRTTYLLRWDHTPDHSTGIFSSSPSFEAALNKYTSANNLQHAHRQLVRPDQLQALASKVPGLHLGIGWKAPLDWPQRLR